LSGVTAAVVGVILNLSVFFALHVLFGTVGERRFGPIRVFIPDWASLDLGATVLTGVALVAIFRVKLGLPRTLALSAALGIAWHYLRTLS
jgi:chromate transporter